MYVAPVAQTADGSVCGGFADKINALIHVNYGMPMIDTVHYTSVKLLQNSIDGRAGSKSTVVESGANNVGG